MAQTTLRDYLQETEDAIKVGRIDDAMNNCRHILTHFPEYLDAQRLLGEVYMAQGQLEDAQQTFDWILANDPENVIAYCDRAIISEGMSDVDTALDCYQQAYELSRGNGQIRQQFNQLSAKVGQQDFMFSRAGLARLYMRGDLLTQAIQEWEAVLSVSPDRLDARLGLLETYWREGLFEQAERIARETLEDIPSCLKALLILAHITSAYNMQQAQELTERAEALDPELTMAQGLFSDLLASQPNDPFLALVRKDPIVLPEVLGGEPEPFVEQTPIARNGSLSPAIASDSLVDWNSLESWSELDTNSMAALQQERQPMQESSAFASWGNIDLQNGAAWAPPHEPEQQLWQPAPDDEMAAEPVTYDGTLLNQQVWYEAEQITTTAAETTSSWENMHNVPPVESSHPWEQTSGPPHAEIAAPWEADLQDADPSAPPAWLDMLTHREKQLVNEPEPMLLPSFPAETEYPLPSSLLDEEKLILSPSSPVAAEPSLPPAFLHEEEPILPSSFPFETEPAPATPSSREWPTEATFEAASTLPQSEQAPPFFFASEESEGDMGWPEWLKSLGAATFETETPAPAIVEPLPAEAPFETWSDIEPWTQQVDELLPEQHVLNTLEHLESGLQAQGFVHLEPGSLSTIAQEPDLSSALAQFGNPAPQTSDTITPPPPVAVPTAESVASVEVEEWDTPSSLVAHSATSMHTSSSQPAFAPPQHVEEPIYPTYGTTRIESTPEPSQAPSYRPELTPQPLYREAPSVPPQQQLTSTSFAPQSRPEPVTTPTFEPVLNSGPHSVPETPLVSSYRADALLENELETTMKRPAIRLQPMQQSAAQVGQSIPLNKGRSNQRALPNAAADSNLSDKERLLKGYQSQLAGDYDTAMQEYRLIIRSAPELLDEIISNVRALLKLAPRYTVGYRVLGDAYMRQGEYLQAMEAYNKALTMAKKLKGQSS